MDHEDVGSILLEGLDSVVVSEIVPADIVFEGQTFPLRWWYE